MNQTPNHTYKPKQLLERLAAADEFEHIFVFGIKKNGTGRYETSTDTWQFYAMAYAFLSGLLATRIKVNHDVPAAPAVPGHKE